MRRIASDCPPRPGRVVRCRVVNVNVSGGADIFLPSTLGRDVTARLFTALVLSRLDYCNALLAGLPASTLAPFHRVLHAAARTVLDPKPCDRVTPAVQELHWLPVAERI